MLIARQKQGFISAIIAVPVGIAVVLLGGITYFGIQYMKVSEENTRVREELEITKEELQEVADEGEVEKPEQVEEANASEVSQEANIDAAVKKTLVEQKSVLQEVSTVEPKHGLEEVEEKEEEPVEEKTNPDPAVTFSIKELSQSIFEEDSYIYGGYGMTITASASGSDVYIPMTTTDSAQGTIGFPYTITGNDFRGFQNSKIACSIRSDGRCKVKDGQSTDITVTVWLIPQETGNYGIRFDEINYSQNGIEKTYTLNENTGIIYLY